MLLAILGTLAALLLGIPAAYRLTHYRVPGGEIVRMLQSVPIIVPGIIVGLALLRTLVIPTGATILLALFPAHSALVLPFAVRVVSTSMENLRTDIEEAAMLLGCSRSGAFRRVVLPNIRGGVLAAVSRHCHQLQPGSGIPVFLGSRGPYASDR